MILLEGGGNMEIGKRIKEHRKLLNMTQEELADKLFVSRQTISSWENDKSYPDIHSLVMLSNLFDITLDDLVKGDIEIMKEQIDKSMIEKFTKQSYILAGLFCLMIVSVVPLAWKLKVVGITIWAIIAIITICYAMKIEKIKEKNDIYSYREIMAFMNGEKLDKIEKAREEGKRKYQRAILAIMSGFITFVVCVVIGILMSIFC